MSVRVRRGCRVRPIRDSPVELSVRVPNQILEISVNINQSQVSNVQTSSSINQSQVINKEPSLMDMAARSYVKLLEDYILEYSGPQPDKTSSVTGTIIPIEITVKETTSQQTPRLLPQPKPVINIIENYTVNSVPSIDVPIYQQLQAETDRFLASNDTSTSPLYQGNSRTIFAGLSLNSESNLLTELLSKSLTMAPVAHPPLLEFSPDDILTTARNYNSSSNLTILNVYQGHKNQFPYLYLRSNLHYCAPPEKLEASEVKFNPGLTIFRDSYDHGSQLSRWSAYQDWYSLNVISVQFSDDPKILVQQVQNIFLLAIHKNQEILVLPAAQAKTVGAVYYQLFIRYNLSHNLLKLVFVDMTEQSQNQLEHNFTAGLEDERSQDLAS